MLVKITAAHALTTFEACVLFRVFSVNSQSFTIPYGGQIADGVSSWSQARGQPSIESLAIGLCLSHVVTGTHQHVDQLALTMTTCCTNHMARTTT